jgi:hypothetical protein
LLKEKTEVAEFDGVVTVMRGCGLFSAVLESGKILENLAGAVCGTVVDDEDLLARGGLDYAAEDFVDGGFFVVDGYDDREFRVVEARRIAARGHREKGL